MITKGIIKETFKDSSTGKWHYRVQLPVFHGTETLPYSDLPEAIYATPPHMEDTKLTAGDIVEVSMENGSLSDLVILGLIPGTTESSYSSAESTESLVTMTNIYSMQVTGSAELPYATNYAIVENPDTSLNATTLSYITGLNLSYLSDVTLPIQSLLDSISKKLTSVYNNYISTQYDITISPDNAIDDFYIDTLVFENKIGGVTSDDNFLFEYNNSIWTYEGNKIKPEDYGFNFTAVNKNCTISLTKLELPGSSDIDTSSGTSSGLIPTGGDYLVAHARGNEDTSMGRSKALGDLGQKYIPDDYGEVSISDLVASYFNYQVRIKDDSTRLKFANKMVYACNNPYIGYIHDNADCNLDLYLFDSTAHQKVSIGAIKDKCGESCCQLVGMMLIATGERFNSADPIKYYRTLTTSSMVGVFLTFKSRYTLTTFKKSTLKIGDIVFTPGCHMAVVVKCKNGSWIGSDGIDYNPSKGELSDVIKTESGKEPDPTPVPEPTTATTDPNPAEEYVTAIKKYLVNSSDLTLFNNTNQVIYVKTSATNCTIVCLDKTSGEWTILKILNKTENTGYIGSSGTCSGSTRLSGSNKTPTGIYKVGTGFGSNTTASYPNMTAKGKYFEVTNNDYWSGMHDDTYNTHVTAESLQYGEQLIQYVKLPNEYYKYSLEIMYNINDSGKSTDTSYKLGYAIFLHLGNSANYGDISVNENVLKGIFAWLEEAAGKENGAWSTVAKYPRIIIL